MAAGTAHRKAVLSVLRRVGDSEGTPPPGAGLAGRASAARVQPRGCKGRSPLHKITLKLPLPLRGRGAGGWGQETKLKAGQAGNKEGKPPLRTPQWQGQPATSRASRPTGTYTAGSARAARIQPRGCKGRSPLHKITFSPPLPHRGRGLGGWGQESKPKAGAAGGKAVTPPAGCAVRPLPQCRAGSSAGMQGAKPLA